MEGSGGAWRSQEDRERLQWEQPIFRAAATVQPAPSELLALVHFLHLKRTVTVESGRRLHADQRHVTLPSPGSKASEWNVAMLLNDVTRLFASNRWKLHNCNFHS
jgi:hypothetical protein